MFYQKGIDICNTKDMFYFLRTHFTYYTMNSWNGLNSIANNVKAYNLNLEGNMWNALDLLAIQNYAEVNLAIEDWEYDHKGYSVGFNGRSGGYLVLTNDENNRNVIPDYIIDCDSYEEFKEYCKEYQYGTMRELRPELRELTKLVQDFDKLCDDLRDYTNTLSKMDFKRVILCDNVSKFNENYYEELKELKIKPLEYNNNSVDISKLTKSLKESFINLFNDIYDRSYCVEAENDIVSLKSLY